MGYTHVARSAERARMQLCIVCNCACICWHTRMCCGERACYHASIHHTSIWGSVPAVMHSCRCLYKVEVKISDQLKSISKSDHQSRFSSIPLRAEHATQPILCPLALSPPNIKKWLPRKLLHPRRRRCEIFVDDGMTPLREMSLRPT